MRHKEYADSQRVPRLLLYNVQKFGSVRTNLVRHETVSWWYSVRVSITCKASNNDYLSQWLLKKFFKVVVKLLSPRWTRRWFWNSVRSGGKIRSGSSSADERSLEDVAIILLAVLSSVSSPFCFHIDVAVFCCIRGRTGFSSILFVTLFPYAAFSCRVLLNWS